VPLGINFENIYIVKKLNDVKPELMIGSVSEPLIHVVPCSITET